jgi:DNA-binding HxlR family transcriptional regulator
VNINSIPESLQSKIRIAIVSTLITGDKTFSEIKEITKATDGNLSVHLSKLEEMSYVTVTKEFIGKKPRTTYSLAETGRIEFIEYVSLLEKILADAKMEN